MKKIFVYSLAVTFILSLGFITEACAGPRLLYDRGAFEDSAEIGGEIGTIVGQGISRPRGPQVNGGAIVTNIERANHRIKEPGVTAGMTGIAMEKLNRQPRDPGLAGSAIGTAVERGSLRHHGSGLIGATIRTTADNIEPQGSRVIIGGSNAAIFRGDRNLGATSGVVEMHATPIERTPSVIGGMTTFESRSSRKRKSEFADGGYSGSSDLMKSRSFSGGSRQ